MSKKILSVILAAAMAVGMFTACSKDSDSEGGNAAGNDAIQNLIDNTKDTVTLKVWASEEDQEFTKKLIDKFTAQYPDVKFDISLESCSESVAKDTVLADPEAAADVFAFADDQLNELVKAKVLQEVSATYTYDVKSENLQGAVDAATIDGKLYAYPMTADNGFFLFYDSRVYSEDDIKSLDKMIEVAKADGTKIGMTLTSGWYNYAFFKGAGLDVGLNSDGLTNYCNWNQEGGVAVCQAILDYVGTGVFISAQDADFTSGAADGVYSAVVSGTWDADAFKAAWGDGYAAAKLPTFTAGGKEYQMSSFSGYKLIGVNTYTKYTGWSMLLAEFLTNAENQEARFEARGLGPANAKASESEAVLSNPAIAALAQQAAYATPQRVGGNYWAPTETLGAILASGNPDNLDLQKLLDDTVAGVEAPV